MLTQYEKYGTIWVDKRKEGKKMGKLTLRGVRVSQGLTLREVAKRVDRNFQTISKYEKDSTKIPADLLMKLLNLYDTPIESIFLGKSTKKNVF